MASTSEVNEPQSQSLGASEDLCNDGMSLGQQDVTKAAKRSCNHCRQQKLRCDVIRSPFSACSRCRRLGKTCRIDARFKRVEKRDKFTQMQCQIDDLRRKLRLAQGGEASTDAPVAASTSVPDMVSPFLTSTTSRQMGEVVVSGETLDNLYSHFFSSYHPFLPILNATLTPNEYFGLSQFLGWSIVMVAARRFNHEPNLLSSLAAEYIKLLWSTIANAPQSYQVVKALCLLCFWPLPTTKSTWDPTFQLSSIMMQIAVQNMLHLPFKTQDPSRGNLPDAEQRDRLMTWIACNIVAQSTSSVYGYPPQTIYDWVLGSDFRWLPSHQLPKDLMDQLRIAHFCNTVTRTLYCSKLDPSGLLPIMERSIALDQLSILYNGLEAILGAEISIINQVHLLAANIHLNAFAFFLPSTSPSRDAGFLKLNVAICTFLLKIMDFETSSGTLLEHCSHLVSQTIFSALFALVKLLNSPLARNIDVELGKVVFNGAILASRRISLQKDDMASRVATRVPLLWRELGAGAPWSASKPDPLVLKVQFRMSVSHGYDCMWAWLESVKAGEISAQNNEKAASSSALDVLTTPVTVPVSQSYQLAVNNMVDASFGGLDIESYNLFNSMDWMLGDWAEVPLAPYDFSSRGTL